MSTLYVGLDLAENTFTACLMLEDGTEPTKRCTFPHDIPGTEMLVEKILMLAQAHQCTRLKVGVEATGLLWWHIASTLPQHPSLKALRPEAFCLNARQVANFKKSYAEVHKTDPNDAFIVAERLRFRGLPHPFAPDEAYLALQRLSRHRFHLVRDLASEKNRFLNHLFLKFPSFLQEEPFSDTFGAASIALLTEFLTVDEIASQSVEALAQFLREKGCRRIPDPEKTAETVQRAARNSYRLHRCLTDPVNMILSMTVANIRFFEEQIRVLDRAIARELGVLPGAQVLRSVPGIGPVFAAGILAEVQDVTRFASDDSLAKFASLIWQRRQSGKFEADETPMLHSGNTYLRYYLVEAANSVRMHTEEYRAFYESKYNEATTHRHKRACVLTARKLVRLVYYLLLHGQLYQPPQSRKEKPADPTVPVLPPGELARHIVERRRGVKRRAASACQASS